MGAAPDVVSVRRTYVGPFAGKNVLTPLTPDGLNQVGIKQGDFISLSNSSIRQHRRFEATANVVG